MVNRLIVLICSLFLLHNTPMAGQIVEPEASNSVHVTPGTWTLPFVGTLPDFGWTEQNAPALGVNPYQIKPVGDTSKTQPVVDQYNQQSNSTLFNQNQTTFPGGLVGDTQYGPPKPQGPPAPIYNPGTADNTNAARISGVNPTAADVNPADRNAWAIQRGFTGWDNYLDSLRSQGPSQDQISAQIDAAYGPTMDYLNQNVNYIGQQKTAAEQAAAADLAANQGILGTNKEQTLGQLATQRRGVQTQKEDALAQARRLFNELQRGNIQRFGGATSAGQAASEIQGAEAQRQFGQTGRQANEAFQKIEQAKTEVESQYKTGLLQLQQAHQQGLAKIQSDFTNAIMQINNQRAATEQAKGQAKLQALQNLRQEALQLQSQATQFQQQLDLMREQANLNIQQYAKTVGTAASTGASAMNTFGTQSQQTPSFSQVQSLVGQNLGNQYVGSIKKPEEWQYQGAISKAVVGRLPDGRALYSDGTAGWSN